MLRHVAPGIFGRLSGRAARVGTPAGVALVVRVIATAGVATAGVGHGVADHPGTRRATGFTATVAYAVDGDTLRIREADGDPAYVRLVGIDTPEDVKPGSPVECGSKAAAQSM